MKRIVLAVTIFAASCVQSPGTSQEPEHLIYLGRTNDLFSTPLDGYFTSNNPMPEVWSKLLHNNSFAYCSGCWRKYIGTWSIRTNMLYLDNINFFSAFGQPATAEFWENGKTNIYSSPLPLLLPGKQLPLMADWFSGVLRLPQGKQLRYVHMGFGSIYEHDLYLKIDQGKVIAEKTINNLDDPNLYTSDADNAWREIGNITSSGGVQTDDPFVAVPHKLDPGDWHDARMVRTTNFLHIINSGTNFSTRGILFIQKDVLFGDSYHLTVPPTPLTQWVDIPLNEIPDKASKLNGSHVEIECHFIESKHGHLLNVQSIRMLNRGKETIHKPDYKLPTITFDTANESPGDDPFAHEE